MVYESSDQGHFGGDYYKETFPELLEAIKKKISPCSTFPYGNVEHGENRARAK